MKMVDSSKSTSAYETLIRLHDKITCLNGIITPEGVDKLEDELGGVCTLIKMHQYREGQKYGHLASVILQEKYRIIISDNAWTHTALANPGAFWQLPLAWAIWRCNVNSLLPSTRSSNPAMPTT
jgi:hypothetical protein